MFVCGKLLSAGNACVRASGNFLCRQLVNAVIPLLEYGGNVCMWAIVECSIACVGAMFVCGQLLSAEMPVWGLGAIFLCGQLLSAVMPLWGYGGNFLCGYLLSAVMPVCGHGGNF